MLWIATLAKMMRADLVRHLNPKKKLKTWCHLLLIIYVLLAPAAVRRGFMGAYEQLPRSCLDMFYRTCNHHLRCQS